MNQEKFQVKAADGIQECNGLIKCMTFLSIRARFLSLREIEHQFRGSSCVPHMSLSLLWLC